MLLLYLERAKFTVTRNPLEGTENKEEKLILEQQLQEAQQIEKLKVKLDSILVAVPRHWLEMYEHRPLLEQAIQDSQKRLMIISPWIGANVVNKQFSEQLEKL